MEEADLLKERLQAITDKRRIQEDIAKKKRQIEEKKLKLQYLKKKARRDQWLMDGLNQPSEKEQETMRLQVQDEQQESDQLQSNILRIEKEIEALEVQELDISANEEVVLKRLKAVERTAEDIIKELNAESQADVTHYVPSSLPDIPASIPLTPAQIPPICNPGSEEPKKATFAIEISVVQNKRTGKAQVVSTVPITAETIPERGQKVYDDGRKSVHALHSEGSKMHSGAAEGLTSTEVEELLRMATDQNMSAEVQYHRPVYSVPYTGSSRPSTPAASIKAQRETLTPSPRPFQYAISSINRAEIFSEENQQSQDLEGWKTQSKSLSPMPTQQDTLSRVQKSRDETKPYFPGQAKSDNYVFPQPHFPAKTPRELNNSKMDIGGLNPAALVSVKTSSEEMPAPIQPAYTAVDNHSPSLTSYESDPNYTIETPDHFNRPSPFCAESITPVNIVDTLPDELESQPVTMIFMGYENAEEEEDIQAELVIIANSDDDDGYEAKYVNEESDAEECLSYHPEGYKSKVFHPKVDTAMVTGCRDIIEGTCTKWDDLGLHKPTFIHKHGKHSP